MQHRLKNQIGILFFFIGGVFILIMGYTYYIIDGNSQDATVVNLAGRQRMLTQKMTKEIFIYAKNPVLENQERFLNTARLFDESLKALKEGSKEMMLAELKDPKALSCWQECAKAWEEFYKHVRGVAETRPGSPEFEKHLAYVRDHNLNLLKNKRISHIKK